MTLNSLRTFLRVRLHTAISLMVDIADSTESLSSPQSRINRSSSSHFTAIAPLEIRLQRLSGISPVRYQSAMALQLASKTTVRPQELAMALCDAYDTLAPPLIGPSWPFSIAANATGWLTLSLSCTSLMAFLDQSLSHWSSGSSIQPHDFPFLIWQTDQRCQSLRSHLERNPVQAPLKDAPPYDESLLQCGPTQSAFSALMEALLDWMDDEGPSKMPHKALIRVCQCLDRLHQQVPLFHPHTTQHTQHQFLKSLAWVQGAIRHEVVLMNEISNSDGQLRRSGMTNSGSSDIF